MVLAFTQKSNMVPQTLQNGAPPSKASTNMAFRTLKGTALASTANLDPTGVEEGPVAGVTRLTGSHGRLGRYRLAAATSFQK